MTSPLFIDANVPMYAAGAPHRLKELCLEVLQELVHRYVRSQRWTESRTLFHGFVSLMDGRIEPVHGGDVVQAASLADRDLDLSARDLLHTAIMIRVGSDRIVSADRDFDRVPNVERLDPADLASWRQRTEA